MWLWIIGGIVAFLILLLLIRFCPEAILEAVCDALEEIVGGFFRD